MQLCMYSVFDNKAKIFLQPFFMQNDAVATRFFVDAANDPDSIICKHPEDYALMYLGTFDNETSEFYINVSPHSLGLAASFKNQSAKE